MTLNEKITEAKAALHNLMIGKGVVSITKDGRSVTYSASNRADLVSYIADLEAQANSRRRRPMGIRL